MSFKIVNVVGARPNFVKIAPLLDAYRIDPRIEPILIHTGQHYDHIMSEVFFQDLGIPVPDYNLGVGSGSHVEQIAKIMLAFEPLMNDLKPQCILVVGDVNSTVACAMVGCKLGIPVAHVESGLRSGDRSMPEEINRIITDSISDLLFCTENSAMENLRREGVDPVRFFFVGNVMIDSLMKNISKAEESAILQKLSLEPRSYILLTLHRPSNVDNDAVLNRLLDTVEIIARDTPVIFPVHPRTLKKLQGRQIDGLRTIEPLGYLDFLKLMAGSKIVLTDSGSVQEESLILKTKCLTLRDNTERPITVEMGSNRVVGTREADILLACKEALARDYSFRVPPLWDGNASKRITRILVRHFLGD